MSADPMARPVAGVASVGADGSARRDTSVEVAGGTGPTVHPGRAALRGTPGPSERSSSQQPAPRPPLAGGALWLPRNLHPIAWWLWALGLVVAASRTTNPFLLLAIVAVAGFVVVRRRGTAPWARAFRYYLIFGVVVVVIRVVTRVVFGGAATVGNHLLFTLPSVPLPDWAAGVSLGGPVLAEAMLAAVYEGLRLATIIACIGAANALANPKRALRVLPGALYELGVAVVISITVAPQLIVGVQRVRRARRLRGGATRGLRALGSIALPVLHDALDRSLALAAAMDSRGYGRRAAVPESRRRVTVGLLIGGLVALCVGVYGMLGGSSSPRVVLPAMTVGVLACIGGLAVGSKRVGHTDFAPDPWDLPESLVTLAGLVCAVTFVVVNRFAVADLNPSLSPLAWPTVPLVPLLAVLVAATPAVTAPRPPVPRASRGARTGSAGSTDAPAAGPSVRTNAEVAG